MNFEIYASLPFLTLSADESVCFGPALFCPAESVGEYFDGESAASFIHYLEKLGVSPKSAVCIGINKKIPQELKEQLMLDALHLFYFLSVFRDLYQGLEVPNIRSFTKYLTAAQGFTLNKNNGMDMRLATNFRQTKVQFDKSHLNVADALGKVLAEAYQTEKTDTNERKLIRSVRLFVNSFIGQFENILSQEGSIPKKLLVPEEILSLNAAFEALLDIDISHLASNFKQKLRPMLSIRYSRPVEMLWKWVDGFCVLYHAVTREGSFSQRTFRCNENIEVPYLHLGNKLYIYAVLHSLARMGCLEPLDKTPNAPPRFGHIDPDEILAFFWTEEGLLKKISILLMQLARSRQSEGMLSEASRLVMVFNKKIDNFYRIPAQPGVRFFRNDSPRVKEYAHAILNLLIETVEIDSRKRTLEELLPKNLKQNLQRYIL